MECWWDYKCMLEFVEDGVTVTAAKLRNIPNCVFVQL